MSLWHPTKPAYPIADQIQTLGSPTLRWLEIYSQLPVNFYNLGDTILRRDDTANSTTSTTYVKVKEFYVPKLIPKTSKLRIYFELASYYEGYAAYAKIYRNGSPYGTERVNTSTTFEPYTEDLEFSEGDYIQIYAKCGTGGRAQVRNFRIQGSPVNQLFDLFGRIQSRLDEYAGLLFGDGGATLDVNLYRSAADVLKTDDNLDALALRIGGTEVISSARKLRNIASIIQSLLPDADNTYDLGSSTYRWRNLILAGYGNLGSLQIGGTEVIDSSRNLKNVFADAGIITSGRFGLARLPTSATANRFLVVRTANADPVYDVIVADDIPSISRSKISNFWDTPFWGNIPDKPSTFPPSAHTHSRSDVTDFWSSPFWTNIPDTPSTYPPSAHTHARADVTDFWSSPFWGNIPDKPNTFPPSTHASSHEYGGSDLVRNLDYLAIQGTTVIDSSRKLQNIASIAQTLLPDVDETYNLGSETIAWRYIYPMHIRTRSAKILSVSFETYDGSAYQSAAALVAGIFTISRAGSIYPASDGDYHLGSLSYRWNDFYAINKSAAFKHPLHNPERMIVFRCVESPKVTVEDWGIAELKNGKAFVGLSEEFVALMSDKAEYAVFLTPEGECNGLYVSKKEFYGFEVRELKGGTSNVRFSWQVKAIRIGDEETPVLEEPTPAEPEKREEWEAKRREATQKKEENRLNRMKQQIAKYREVTGKP